LDRRRDSQAAEAIPAAWRDRAASLHTLEHEDMGMMANFEVV
jgi:FtsP/CotA-like multicopper oxidase with cupredoxin domain